MIVFDPELTRQVLHASSRDLAFVGDAAQVLISEHTFVTFEEQDHLEWRRRISRVLTGEELRSYAGLMRDRTDRAIDSWPVGEPFSLVGPLQRLMGEIIADLVLGPGDGPRREELLDALWALPREKAPRELVEELLVDEGRAMDVGDQAITLLLAGAETTAATLAWAFELLLRDPAALASVQEDGYVRAVIKESLRLHPPVPHAQRRVLDRPYELGGFVMAPGTEIRASLSRIGDPAFRPERHLAGGDDGSLTFGAGSHRCLGVSFTMLETEIVLARVLERLRLRLLDPRPERPAPDAFTTVPARGVRVIAEHRC